MPKTIKNEDGSESTVYTQEEVNAQKSELDAAKAELEKAQQAAAASGDKDFNFRQLEKRVKDAESAVEATKRSSAEEIAKIRTDMSNTALEAGIKGLAGEDAELAKKVRFHFTETLNAVQASNPEEFTKKLQQAYLLAAEQPIRGGMPGSVYGSGGAAPAPSAGSAIPVPQHPGGRVLPMPKQEVMEMGKRYFGLSDDDFKKFSGSPTSTTK